MMESFNFKRSSFVAGSAQYLKRAHPDNFLTGATLAFHLSRAQAPKGGVDYPLTRMLRSLAMRKTIIIEYFKTKSANKKCRYAFRLKAKNGEIIAQSEGYATKIKAMKTALLIQMASWEKKELW